MSARSILLALVGLVGLASADEARVFWNNGNGLTGELLSAEDGVLHFASPIFTGPFELKLSRIDSLVYPAPDTSKQPLAGWSVAAPEKVRVLVAGGQVLFGEIDSMTAEVLALRTGPDQLLEIRRPLIREIAPLQAKGQLYVGPSGLEGWEVVRSNRGNRGSWTPSFSNALRTARWGAIFRPMEEEPSRGMATVELRSSERLQFSIALDKKSDRGPRLETWADELVLVHGDDFEPVETYDEESREVIYTLMWDFEAGFVQVANASGKRLARLELSEEKKKDRHLKFHGVFLRNKGVDLALRQLRIAEWDGDEPTERDPDAPGLRLTDGSTIAGEVTGYTVGSGFRIAGKTVPLEKTVAISRAPETPDADAAAGQVRVAYRDGQWFEADLNAIDESGVGKFSAAWATKPFSLPLAGVRKIQFPKDESPDEDAMPDLLETMSPSSPAALTNKSGQTLKISGGAAGGDIRMLLKGRIVGSEAPGSAAIQFQPYGSKNASAILPGLAARLTKDHAKEYIEPATEPDEKTPSDRLFLTNGDVISAQLKTLDAEAATFSVDFAEVESFGADALRAVELVGNRVNRSGLDDPGWAVLSEEGKGVEIEKGGDGVERILLTAGGYYGHPSMLSGGNEIAFSLKTGDHSAYLAVGLFISEITAELATQRLQVGFYFNGDRLYLQSGRGANGMQFNDQIGLKESGTADVKILLVEGGLAVMINDTRVMQIDADVSDRLGSGIVFANAANGPFVQMESEIALTKFSVKRSRGVLLSQQVNEEAKAQALTVPRMRRERPSSHALIARNGDLLRGRLDQVSGDDVRFVSRLESFDFPRERIGAIVWLKEPPAEAPEPSVESAPAAAAPAAPSPPAVLAVFNDGSRIGLDPTALSDTTLTGTSDLLGPCRVPVVGLRELRLNGWTPRAESIAYDDWKLTFAPEPVLPEAASGADDEMVGQKAPDLELPILGEKAKFDLQDHGGKVVVLDFWATWCGPCIRAIPGYLEMIAEFDPEDAILIGVNQGEAEENVSEFLVRRGDEWTALDVVMDGNQSVGAAFGVEAIPHTVIVDTEGNVAWVETGFREGAAEEMAALIRKLLGR